MDVIKPKTKSPKPRAKMYLRAKLGWLWGYPLSVENQSIQWQQLHYPMPWDTASLSITHQQIASASVSRNKLLSDFPRILPSLVGDTADWSTLLTLKLQALRALTEGTVIDPVTALLSTEIKNGDRLQRKAKELSGLYPKLQPIIKGFIWWLSLDNKALTQALQWIEQNDAALHVIAGLETDAVRNAAIMFTLAQQTSNRSSVFLLNLAAHPIWEGDNLRAKQRWFDELCRLQLACHNSNDTEKLLSFTAQSSTPTTTNPPAITRDFWFTFCESLLFIPRRERSLHLEVLQHLLALELLDNWLELKQDLYQQIALIKQTLHDTQQQLMVINQQLKLIRHHSKKTRNMLQTHPGLGELERRFPKRELAAQLRQYHEQQESLEHHHDKLLDGMSSQLELLCMPSPSPVSTLQSGTHGVAQQIPPPCSNASQKLSYLPIQRDFNLLLDFGLQNRSRLKQFQTLTRSLQPQHDWHGADRLLRMATHWEQLHYNSRHNEPNNLPAMLDSVLIYLRQADNGDSLNRRLLPWSNLLNQAWQDRQDAYEIFDFKIGVYGDGFDERDSFLQLLGMLCESQTILSKTANTFHQFWHQTPRHWPHVTFFSALQNQGIQLSHELKPQDFCNIDSLLGSDHTPENFLCLIKTWQLHQVDEDNDEIGVENRGTNVVNDMGTDNDAADADAINSRDNNGNIFAALTAAARLSANDYPEVVEYFKDRQQWQILAALKPIIEQYEKLTKTTAAPPPLKISLNQAASWQQHYPPALQTALNTLRQLHQQAQKVATTMLSKHFPQPDTLQQEISALESRIPLTADQSQQQAMIKRRDNLQQRLENPTIVSTHQLAKLQQKLRHAAYTQLLDSWQAYCYKTFQHHLAKHFDLPHVPEQWLQDKRKARSLVALTELDDAEQKMAGLLLRAHLAGEDQDLRKQPANRDWLESMGRSGLSMQAWLSNETFEVAVEAKSNQTITLQLRFADDIFDILQMGDHFNTCLSHDDFNFFSVVANAADLNKRVVYAYDATGRIQGRCLLGITREKYLVAFHPYSHLGNDAFKKALDAFISWLEQEIGIQRSHEGKVPLLLARDWYDDGVETIMPEYAALKPKSAFRQQLNNLAPQHILSSFRQAIAPHVLNDFALSQLLRQELFYEKPEYLFAVYQQIQQSGAATIRTNSAIVETLLRKEKIPHKQIWPLAKDWIYDFIFKGLKLDNDYSPALIGLLLSQNPILLLRLTRSVLSAPKASDYYHSGDLQVYQARALIAIHRPRKAAATYQAAIASDEDGYYHFQYFRPQQVQQEIDTYLARLDSDQQS